MKASTFLDSLYEAVYRTAGLPPPGEQDVTRDPTNLRIVRQIHELHSDGLPPEEARVVREAAEQALEAAAGNVLSKYEDPFMISILRDVADRVEAACREAGVPLPDRPLLGTLPHGDVNARTMLVPGTGEHLVLFESQLILFAHLAAKAVVEALPLGELDDGRLSFDLDTAHIRAALEAEPRLAARFVEVLLGYAVTGRPGFARQYLQSRKREALTRIFRNALEFFVLGHEYGHIVSRHLGERRLVAGMDIGGDDAEELPEEVLYSWKQELEADVRGVEYAIPPTIRAGYDLTLGYAAGPDFYFTLMDVFSRAMQLLRTGTEEVPLATSHPPAALRREALRRSLRDFLGDAADGPLHLATTLQEVVEGLWAFARPTVLNAREHGVRPRSTWR
ncbi:MULTISPECIES: hypothetical protein [unclassified Saccharothrix]|uniref:hypothetical protein n=1 Tax=unclassified Saccharothrix TaxID=2593673 RepID=UPI00307E9259